MTDILHNAKITNNLPWQGYTEKAEGVAKSITPALGLTQASQICEDVGRRIAHLVEYHKGAKIVKEVDISFNDGLSKHLFFVDDAIVNAALFAGSAYIVIANFALLIPMLLIWAFYFGSDRFIQGLRKLT